MCQGSGRDRQAGSFSHPVEIMTQDHFMDIHKEMSIEKHEMQLQFQVIVLAV